MRQWQYFKRFSLLLIKSAYMKITKALLLVVVAFLLFNQQLLAQKQPISGKITDSKGTPIEGVTVKIKSTKAGTSTDKDGKFTLNVLPTDVLEINSVGFKIKTVPVSSKSYNISLEAAPVDLQEVVMVGSRKGGRVKTESPVPVDVININSVGETSAKADLESILNMSVPSFNYNKQSGADGSDAIDFASLRGLGFDQTLVLINGKRRHLSAFVSEFGTRGRGNSGTDLNAIPEAAIDRVEILRDGASAQYGSDAIAGVINIILKKDVKKLTVNAGYSGYYDHKYNTLNNVDPTQYYTGSQLDGKTFNLGVNYGLPIGTKGGFINFGANFLNQAKTLRAVPDTNWTTNQHALSTDTWRRAFGDGGVVTSGIMYNAEIPIAGTKTTFYSFGSYNYKHSNVYAWTRDYSSKPFKFPTLQDGSLVFVGDIMRRSSDGETYYNPQEDVFIKDASIALGLKGTTNNNWDWDLSNVTGHNDFHYYGNKTFNASLLPINEQPLKTRFDDGGFNFLQNTTNLDFSKHLNTVASGLTISLGAEFRYERYQIYKGETDSYSYGGAYYVDNAGDTVNKASGSQGFPGFQPVDEVVATRTNVGGYADFTLDVTKAWLIDAALRIENYSDFGFVNTYKLASRYKVSSNFNIRGSVSTGFRAPSLQQLNFSNTNTNIVGGQLQYVKLVPNYSPIARIAGIPKLTQEQSVNASLGFSWKPVRNFTVTLDGYWVQLKNRVVFSGQFSATLPTLAPYIPQNPPISSVQFFANAVNTTNTGVDIVLDYSKKWGTKSFKALLAGNLQNIIINKINVPAPLSTSYFDQQTFFSSREQAFLIASAPKSKFSLNLEYGEKKWSVGTHITYYGKLTTQGFGYSSLPGAPAGGPGGAGISDQGLGYDPYVTTDDGKSVIPEVFIFHGKVTTDLYTSYKLSKHISWVVGVDNILNVHPDLAVTTGAHMSSWGDSESGGPFDSVQMGYNGLRIFSRILLNF